MVQWIRIHLPMQETWVGSLVWEDSTCYRATKPASQSYWARVLQLPKPVPLEPALREATARRSPRTATKSSPCSPQPEKACAQQQRPSAIKNKSVNTRHYKATVVETACHNSTGVKIDTLDKLNMTEHLEINPHICDQLIFQCCQRDSIGKILYVNGTRITGYLHRKNNEP